MIQIFLVDGELREPKQVDRNGLWPQGLDIHRGLPDLVGLATSLWYSLNHLFLDLLQSRPTSVGRSKITKTSIPCQIILSKHEDDKNTAY